MDSISKVVEFHINGKPFRVNSESEGISPQSKLIDFIRDTAKLKGTKNLCREGGCGLCVVNVATKNSAGVESIKSINSCLTPTLSCDGWDISTIEDLGNRQIGYDPVQKRLAQFCGTQCGFCTPGMIMSMKSLASSNKALTAKDVEDGLDGNICRCTGYRPILDAFKSFASDLTPGSRKQMCCDIEDCLQTPCPIRKKEETRKPCCKFAPASSDSMLSLNFSDLGMKWFKVNSLQNLYNIMQDLDLNGSNKCRLVAGNTAMGIFKQDANNVTTFVDISTLSEIRQSSFNGESIILGGGATITETIQVLTTASESHQDYKYAGVIAKHFLQRVGNTHIRNTATLAGNIMLKHKYPEFASDIFLLFETINAEITLSCFKTRGTLSVKMTEFLNYDLTGKIIISIRMNPIPKECTLRTFKISPRYQNSKSYLNAATLIHVSKTDNFRIIQKPCIGFGGIHPNFSHAFKTEEYLNGKYLGDVTTVKGALHILNEELTPTENELNGSTEFRKNLALSILYKTILGILRKSGAVSSSMKSGGMDLLRRIRTGKQTYVKNNENRTLYSGFPKLESVIQCSGEAEYTNDISPADGEVFGAFVLSTVANCTLKRIDASKALALPGVVGFITAKDIPGTNNYMIWEPTPEEIFATDKIHYAGQAVGLILAETREKAFAAVKLVEIEYANIAPPVLTIQEALDKVPIEGTPTTTITSSVSPTTDTMHVIKGELNIGGQAHFQLEPQSCICIPKEDGIQVFSATQWIDMIQAVISSALEIPANSINVQVKRLGGGFGGKASRSGQVAAACAIAAHVSGRPVRLVLDLETQLKMIGKRLPYYIKYEVGFDDNGKITRLDLLSVCDPGFSPNEDTTFLFRMIVQNCYEALGWKVRTAARLTNTPANTFCRAPGVVQGVAAIENIMEHVAHYLKKDPLDIRMNNMMRQGQQLICFPGLTLNEENPLPLLLEQFKDDADYEQRHQEIDEFNRNNRWRKRGLAIVPVRYPNHFIGGKYSVFVGIYHSDGSVIISHGGIEMGQGINTKIAQVVADTLNIPISKIKVKPTNNHIAANSSLTAAGTTSESCCFAAFEACKILLKRLEPIRKELGEDAGWEKLISEAHKKAMDLTASYMNESNRDGVQGYNVWSLTMTEVEVDILTGEYKVSRLDFSIDGTRSLNPEVDLGQVEGALIFSLGLWTTEKLVYDKGTGQLLTAGTWDYKPPQPKDIPEDFRVTMFTQEVNKGGVLGSKGPGEPPLVSGVSVVFALRHAINSARKDAGNEEWYQIDGPVTPEDVLKLSLTSLEQMSLDVIRYEV